MQVTRLQLPLIRVRTTMVRNTGLTTIKENYAQDFCTYETCSSVFTLRSPSFLRLFLEHTNSCGNNAYLFIISLYLLLYFYFLLVRGNSTATALLLVVVYVETKSNFFLQVKLKQL